MKKILILLVLTVFFLFSASFTTLHRTWSAEQHRYVAVITGVADYPGYYNDLDYPAQDAVGVWESLAQYPHWKPQNMRLLLDGEATKAGIQQAIQAAGAQAGTDDVFLFFFSGHGSTIRDTLPYDEQDRFDETLCAYDADIRDDELADWLYGVNTSHIVVVIDSCHSGGQLDSKSPMPGWRAKVRPGAAATVQKGDGFAADFARRKHAKDMTGVPGCIVVTSSDAHQLSYEIQAVEHGLFTYYVLSAINNFFDRNRNGTLSAEEVGTSVVFSFSWLYARFPWLYVTMFQFPQYYDDYPAGSAEAGQLPLCIP